MKNRYTITGPNIARFTNTTSDAGLADLWYKLHNGETLKTATGTYGHYSTFNPYKEWKLKPNGDGTFSAYRLS